MTDFLIYNLKAGFILSILYMLYAILLRKETYYSFNRIYLLSALVISFVLPALNISLAPSQSPIQNNFMYIEHALQEVSQTLEVVEIQTATKVNSLPVISLLIFIGMITATLRVGFQLIRIYLNIKKHELKKREKYTYVLMDKPMTTHSFFNYIFVQKSDLSNRQRENVLLHEQFHADCWHSFDLLLIGMLSILQWFNPFIYLTKRALTETHEFQADQAVVDRGVDKLHYQQLLLAQSRSIVFAGLTSKFNQSLIKNRLKKMNSIKSKNSVIIKYLLVVPVVFVISIVFAVSQEKINDSIVEVIQHTPDGDIVGKSSFAILEMPEADRFSIRADEIFGTSSEVVRMEGNVWLETFDEHFTVNAEHVLFDKKERKIYAYTDDYVPSIYPIDEKLYKRITSGFGMRKHPITEEVKMHNGMDFSAETGTPIMATANGNVRIAEQHKSYGNRVIIDHGNGFSSQYSQMSKYIVKEGQSIVKGEIIGYVGSTGLSTGPHLHYEVMKDGKYVDPKDYLGKAKE